MKKMLCLALIVLTLACVFTGCNSTVTTARQPGTSGRDAAPFAEDRSNVSTSRDGTVNGRSDNSLPRMGMDSMPEMNKQ